jgi:hypothetical protein
VDAGTVAVTLFNFDSWCTLTANGTAVTSSPQIVYVAPNSTVTLIATPLSSSFEIGPDPWQFSDGGAAQGATSGSGATETSTLSFSIGSSPQCIQVCCPFSSGGGCSGSGWSNGCD